MSSDLKTSSHSFQSGSESNSDDEVSEVSDTSNKEENYDNESFEEDLQDEESEVLSLNTLQRLERAPQKPKNFTNKTFTSAQIREIERQNAILMNKILAQNRKPVRPKSGTLPNKYHQTSAAINRKKNQMKIDWENQILLRKIQSVKPSIRY